MVYIQEPVSKINSWALFGKKPFLSFLFLTFEGKMLHSYSFKMVLAHSRFPDHIEDFWPACVHIYFRRTLFGLPAVPIISKGHGGGSGSARMD